MADIEALRKRLIKRAKEQVREHYAGRDVHIIKAINLLDDLDNIFNLLAEQVREWHATHFPEFGRVVKDNEVLLNLVYELGSRENFSEENILKFYDNSGAAKEIASAVGSSVGADLDAATLGEIKLIARNALNLREERKFLLSYIEKSMKELCPNLLAVAGPVIGAKLLAKAGSLQKLAVVPSSTVQIYGAEKALFQAMRSGSPGPKYGIIFQHPLVKGVRFAQKGRVARSLAGKLSIAARTDFFKGGDIAKTIIEKLEKRAAAIGAGKPETIRHGRTKHRTGKPLHTGKKAQGLGQKRKRRF